MRRRRRELAGEGQRQLEEAIAAAFQILASVDHKLYDPAPWPISRHHQQQRLPVPADFNTTSDADGGGAGEVDVHGGSLDGARCRCKVAVAALRETIAVVPSSAQEIGSTEDKVDEVEIKRSEERASTLRKEIESENKNVKLLTDQLRYLISDVYMLQNPGSV
ncbi:mediator of RNA polymerase II transcription subunit 30-like [Phragmites australis]|uniref:mediator of RNA polymerase II transcription subunit 30-like n=1 Tax=Phragmites australis TaxID=29695 RepID=UPI002D7785C1|nr:mediator of RNA polymerase II transcription subunit 30-like [Phragmites australis]